MATSPNYAWAEPDNSSLVKNGASDIRTLGDAIDTSVWNVGFGQAGKNKLINGDFTINQRSFSSTSTDLAFGFDRWFISRGGTSVPTLTYSLQTFTAGTAPVSGYNGNTFTRLVTTTGSSANEYSLFVQKIEDIRSLAGKTSTVSFWAKAATGTPKIGIELEAAAGSGGSGATSAAGQAVTISTSWTRYSVTITAPSLTGVTIGTGSSYNLNFWTSGGSTYNSRSGSVGNQSSTIDIWGVQVEYGSKATPFQTATGTIQGELAACQRYYQKTYVQTTAPATTTAIGSMNGVNSGTTLIIGLGRLPVVMRTAPTITLYSSATGATGQVRSGGADVAATAADVGDNGIGYLSATGLTAGGNSTIHYAASAEL